MGILDILEDDQDQGGNQTQTKQKSRGSKGGQSSNRGLASADPATRKRVAREGGKASRR